MDGQKINLYGEYIGKSLVVQVFSNFREDDPKKDTKAQAKKIENFLNENVSAKIYHELANIFKKVVD